MISLMERGTIYLVVKEILQTLAGKETINGKQIKIFCFWD
jgi:hypothetical protein